MDPIVTNDKRTNELKRQVTAVLQGLSPQISMHDFRVVWGPTHANLVFDVCVPYEFEMDDDVLKDKIAEAIRDINPHYFSVVTVDHDYTSGEE